MKQPARQWDEVAALHVAGIDRQPTPQEEALVNRYLEIHQGDPQKAGKALRDYLMRIR